MVVSSNGGAVLFSSCAQKSRNADAVSKINNQLSLQETVLKVDMARVLGKMQLECLYNFWYFVTMILLERSICLFCGLGVSKQIFLLGLCGFAVNFPVLGQSPKSGDVQ